MRTIFMMSVIVLSLVGCANSQYNTIQTGFDKFTLSGPDHNQLRSNAYQACRKLDDQFVDYTVVETNQNSILVRCEKEPKSFFTHLSEVYDGVKKKVDDFRHESSNSEKKEEKTE